MILENRTVKKIEFRDFDILIDHINTMVMFYIFLAYKADLKTDLVLSMLYSIPVLMN
jgi:hypothetical protein